MPDVDHDSPTVIRERTRVMAVPAKPEYVRKPVSWTAKPTRNARWRAGGPIEVWEAAPARSARRQSPLRGIPVYLAAGAAWYVGYAIGAWGLGFLIGLVIIGIAVVADLATRDPAPRPQASRRRGRWYAGAGVGIWPFFVGIGRRFGR